MDIFNDYYFLEEQQMIGTFSSADSFETLFIHIKKRNTNVPVGKMPSGVGDIRGTNTR